MAVSAFIRSESERTALFVLSFPAMKESPVKLPSGRESNRGFGAESTEVESTCAVSLVTTNNKIITNAVLLKPGRFYLLVKNLQFCVKLWDFSI